MTRKLEVTVEVESDDEEALLMLEEGIADMVRETAKQVDCDTAYGYKLDDKQEQNIGLANSISQV